MMKALRAGTFFAETHSSALASTMASTMGRKYRRQQRCGRASGFVVMGSPEHQTNETDPSANAVP